MMIYFVLRAFLDWQSKEKWNFITQKKHVLQRGLRGIWIRNSIIHSTQKWIPINQNSKNPRVVYSEYECYDSTLLNYVGGPSQLPLSLSLSLLLHLFLARQSLLSRTIESVSLYNLSVPKGFRGRLQRWKAWASRAWDMHNSSNPWKPKKKNKLCPKTNGARIGKKKKKIPIPIPFYHVQAILVIGSMTFLFTPKKYARKKTNCRLKNMSWSNKICAHQIGLLIPTKIWLFH